MILRGKKGKDREKDLQNERKARRNRKYGQARLKHSKKGILSCVVAGAIAVILFLLLAVAYMNRGKAAAFIGVIGILILVFSWVGLVMGIRGFRERDKNYVTCKVGIGCNAVFLLGLTAIFLRGLL